eukprot:70299-Pleurochrysis_carterae.AAC.1
MLTTPPACSRACTRPRKVERARAFVSAGWACDACEALPRCGWPSQGRRSHHVPEGSFSHWCMPAARRSGAQAGHETG